MNDDDGDDEHDRRKTVVDGTIYTRRAFSTACSKFVGLKCWIAHLP